MFLRFAQKLRGDFMYNTQKTATRIKQEAKNKHISIKQLLSDCDLNINYISQYANGRDMTVSNLFAIADTLGVSVDYLLGRTDDPTGTVKEVNNSYNKNGDHIVQTFGSTSELSRRDAELLQKVNSLDFSDYADLINYLNEKLKNAG